MKTVVKAWHEQRELLLGEKSGEAERLLWTWLGLCIDSKSGFDFFVTTISSGLGCGDDSGAVSLPVNIVEEACEEGRIDREFQVEIRLAEYGDGPDKVARMSVPAFLFCSSVAVVLHARYVDPERDPYADIERVRAGCSPEAQFALVSDRDRRAIGLELEHWQRPAFSPETIDA